MGRWHRDAVLVVEHVHAACSCATSGSTRRARVRDARSISFASNVTWGPEFGDSPFFEGEVEPCINGRVVALGAYFGERSDRLVDRLLSEQLADGGWNCEAERGSVRSSFHTTICVLEGLLAFEQAFGATPAVTDARQRAQEYLLERRLLRRLSTGEIIDPAWTQFAFPTLWHYDVLRALDYLRAAGVQPDARVEEAVAIVLERRQGDGRWLLDVRHRDTLHEELAGTVGAPNRWITLRAHASAGAEPDLLLGLTLHSLSDYGQSLPLHIAGRHCRRGGRPTLRRSR